MPTCEWNEAIGGAVFCNDEGQPFLVVLSKPEPIEIDEWERLYPGNNIRAELAAIAHRWL